MCWIDTSSKKKKLACLSHITHLFFFWCVYAHVMTRVINVLITYIIRFNVCALKRGRNKRNGDEKSDRREEIETSKYLFSIPSRMICSHALIDFRLPFNELKHILFDWNTSLVTLLTILWLAGEEKLLKKTFFHCQRNRKKMNRSFMGVTHKH